MTPETLPLQNIQLIEASAGTGKTWTIAALYVRLILGHGNRDTRFAKPLLPRDILVVTFTKAATAELRERIRKRLTEAAHYFRYENAPPDAFLQTLRTSYCKSKWSGLAHRLAVAADSMDEASIFTIHGWCSRMLKQHAFDSGAPFVIDIEGDCSGLLKEAIRDFWRAVFYPLNEEECRLIRAVVKSPDDLAKEIKTLLETAPEALARFRSEVVSDTTGFRKVLDEHAEQQRIAAEKEGEARALWLEGREAIEQALNYIHARGHLNGRSYQDFPKRLAAFRNWAERGEPLSHEPLQNERWFKLFATGGFNLNQAAKGRKPHHPAFDKLAEWLLTIEPRKESAIALHNAVLTLATFWISEHFTATKTRRASLDYNDLIHKLHAALHDQAAGDRLANIFRGQYPVVLIDEFQDTDAAQYAIFERVYGQAAAATAWLMIGDPKQAIYSFRGADIHTYLRARQGVKRHSLDTNYRSTQALVDAVNRCFAHANNHEGGAFLFKQDGHDPIPFEPVKANGGQARWIRQGREAPALTCWYYAPILNETVQAVGVEAYRHTLANHCANEIARLLHEGESGSSGFSTASGIEPVKAADIAILVRDRTEAQAIRLALQRRSIDSVYLSNRDSVYDSPEAKDLLHCLRAFLSPQDSRLIRAALATSTLNRLYPEIERLHTSEAALDEQIQHFLHYRQLWHTQGVLAAVRQFIMDQALPSRLLARQGGERTLTNLLHLSELLQAEGVHRDGPEGLLRYLAESLDNDDDAAEENTLRLESDQGLIRVVTIHKAKGLEYPLVFLPFICSFRKTEKSKINHFKYHDAKGQLILKMTKGCEDEGLSEQSMDKERLQEDIRLLYVALTRARHAVWLGTAPLKKGNGADNQLHQTALGHLLSDGKQIPNQEIKSRLDELLRGQPAAVIVEVKEVEAEQPIRHAPKNAVTETGKARAFQGAPFSPWSIASYSGLLFEHKGSWQAAIEAPDTARFDQVHEEAIQDNAVSSGPVADQETLHGFPAGTEPGVLLHSLLETVAFHGFNRVSTDADLRSTLIAKVMKGKSYVDWHARLDTWLVHWLSTNLSLDQQSFSLSALTAADCLIEMEFWFQVNGVDTRQLDEVVKAGVLPEQPRPVLYTHTLNGMLKGFIDLVFHYRGRYYVVDYKSNRLGTGDADYAAPNLHQAMLKHRYDLQYSLYLLALHRYLRVRLGKHYDYERDIGGAVYLFLRGLDNPQTRGIYHHKPPLAMMESLDRLFDNSDSPALRAG